MNEKWSKEKAWDWYNKLPWLRGFNFIPSKRMGPLETFQEYKWDESLEIVKEELSIAVDWGFNFIRIYSCLPLFIDQHDSYLNHLDTFLKVCKEKGIYVIFVFGDDCCAQKRYCKWPTYGRDSSFDLGYHSGRKHSPHVVLDEPGWSFLDDPKIKEKYLCMVKEIVTRYKDSDLILIYDMFNEPGNSRRENTSWPVIEESFKIAREINPVQPLSACCWWYTNKNEISQDIQKKCVELSDVITYHCYHENKRTIKISKKLLKLGRPLINTEWLHRIWHNDVDGLYEFFYKHKIACCCWGFVTGYTQTREPWEWLFHEYDLGHGKNWDFSKWQHDLVRANHRPYDFKEYELITKINKKADNK